MFQFTSVDSLAGMTGEVSVPTGSAAAITATSFTCKSGVLVLSLPANTATVYIGDSTVTTSNGLPLAPGDRIFIPVINPASIFVISGSSGQKIRGIGA